jgi:hypothetical protein
MHKNTYNPVQNRKCVKKQIFPPDLAFQTGSNPYCDVPVSSCKHYEMAVLPSLFSAAYFVGKITASVQND